MSRGTKATIHLAHLRHNLSVVRRHAPDKSVWAVIKAGAYGHGLIPVAHTLASQVDGLAVATLGEAQTLREAGISQRILLLEGALSQAQTQQAMDESLELVVHTPGQLDWLEECDMDDPVRIWIKLDTGMHRLGLMPDEVPDVLDRIRAMKGVRDVAFMTHYACADEPESLHTAAQAERFFQQVPPDAVTSLANSAGVLLWPDKQGDWVRPGIILYGASPCDHRPADYWGLKAAMTVTAPVIALRDLGPGEHIGYGASYTTDRPVRLATVAIGYADGYPRHAPSGTPAWIRGHRVSTLGRVSMDMLTIDVTEVPDVALGDQVELWGTHVSVDDVARSCGTIGYELLARLSIRGHYDYQDAESVNE